MIPHPAPQNLWAHPSPTFRTPSLQEVISPCPQQAHRGLVTGGQVEDQVPALQLHQTHSDEEVEGPGGPGHRPSGRVGRSPQNPKAWGEECGMLVVTSPETFCQGPHAGASQHGVVLDSSAPFWGKATAGYSARLGVQDHRIAFQPVGPQEGLLGEGVFGVSLAEGRAFRPG
jgi:hypothetical protein